MTDFSKLSDYIIGIRRTLHKHPELSGQEFQTQQLIRSELDKLGIPHRTLHKTDILAEITGLQTRPGKPLPYRLKSTVKQFCCAQIWMPCLLRKIQTRPMSHSLPASCMPADTTPIRPCCWGRQSFFGTAVTIFPAPCGSCFSRRRKPAEKPER